MATAAVPATCCGREDQRPAGECTCSRAQTENAGPKGESCACGKRSSDSCTCGGTEADSSELETDFTTKKAL
ncbi:hypothetical protein LTR17_016156 [Elasticomyces elasticus]|nr:hypothetical protein LTR17_016156 [Elasticomyces elasticus]